MTKRNEYIPQTISHPGLTLREKLVELGMSQKEFAVRTGKPEQTIVKVINGESSLTPDMAVQFESVLGIPANFWLKRQQNYDEAVARAKRRDVLLSGRDWARSFPCAKMTQLGWLPKTEDSEQQVEVLLCFFGISGHQAWDDFYCGLKLKVSFRISLAHSREPYAISAWLRQGELEAAKLVAPSFSAKTFKTNLEGIKKVMAGHPEDFFPLIQQLCLEAGVKVVSTPCLPKAPIHGSTRWINDSTPLIQLSARYKQNDRFWFTFFHEAGHILLHGKKYISLEDDCFEAEDKVKEAEADAFAVRWTFSEEEERAVIESGALTESDIIDFAQKFGTHPAMIIGRFHHKKLLPYHIGRQFIQPVHFD
ncbi:MAG: HigA family addiction module antidote protein [Chlorobium sp.]|nr:MAG: HigA family addiction module antidote protein [Chlorobium sp.]